MSETFAYGLRGPWPQPSPLMPFGMPPAVVHVPWEEQVDFAVHVMTRLHLTSWAFRPAARLWAMANPGLAELPDAELERMFGQTVFSRFVCPTLDPQDRETFASFLAGAGPYAEVDFSAMAHVQAMPGYHAAPTVTLVELGGPQGVRLRAICIGDVLLGPQDGPAWDLSKYFVMQGATNHLVLGGHACLHFPMDAINAITKTAVPRSHPLYQLLEPHFRFSLALDDGVLHHPRTLLNNAQTEVFTPLVGPGYDLIPLVYKGVPGNSAYPGYRFTLEPPAIASPYGTFLAAYFEEILSFTRRVTAHPAFDDGIVATWATHVRPWVPGFPDGEAIADPETRARALAYIIADVSVMHAADHHDYASQPITRLPFRLRLPPPTDKAMPPFDRSKLATQDDMFRYKMAQEMFFKPNNVTLLADVQYAFEDPDLQAAARTFRRDLRALDADLPCPRYIPLREISASIQY